MGVRIHEAGEKQVTTKIDDFLPFQWLRWRPCKPLQNLAVHHPQMTDLHTRRVDVHQRCVGEQNP